MCKNSVAIGDKLFFGPYMWRVLDVSDGKALLITDDVIGVKQKHDSNKGPAGYGCSESCCDVNKYLNGEFLEGFSEAERALIVNSDVHTKRDSVHYFEEYSPASAFSWKTRAEIFLLDDEEAGRYFKDNKDRIAMIKYTPEALLYDGGNSYWREAHTSERARLKAHGSLPIAWLLRNKTNFDTGSHFHTCTGYVNLEGKIGLTHPIMFEGLRPACWVNIDGFGSEKCLMTEKD